jgi:hypothetical protein
LDPFKLNKLTQPTYEIIPIPTSAGVLRNAELAFGDEEDEPKKAPSVYPIPIAPDFVFSRLAIQNGAFTIHGTNKEALERQIPLSDRNALLKFVASAPHLDRIYSALELLKPSSDAIFPDMEGLIDYIV